MRFFPRLVADNAVSSVPGVGWRLGRKGRDLMTAGGRGRIPVGRTQTLGRADGLSLGSHRHCKLCKSKVAHAETWGSLSPVSEGLVGGARPECLVWTVLSPPGKRDSFPFPTEPWVGASGGGLRVSAFLHSVCSISNPPDSPPGPSSNASVPSHSRGLGPDHTARLGPSPMAVTASSLLSLPHSTPPHLRPASIF